MSASRTPRLLFVLLSRLLFISFLTVSTAHADSTLTEAPALGPAEHTLPDPEGFRPELWSPDGTALVLTRDHRDIRILEVKSGLLWDIYSLAEPSPVRIPIAWDSTGAALRFLDYPAEAIRTYDLKSGALSAFHVRDPFLLREMWRGIEAPETRSIVWWDTDKERWAYLPSGETTSQGFSGSGNKINPFHVDSSGEWMAGERHLASEGVRYMSVGPLAGGKRYPPIPMTSSPRVLPVRGILPYWQPGAHLLWFVSEEPGTDGQLSVHDPVRFWYEKKDDHTQPIGLLTGGQVLHIAIAPGGKRVAWLTPTGIYTANIE